MNEPELRNQVISATTAAMNAIFHDIPKVDFREEANALIGKWAKEHGSFGLDGLVEAMMWWQDQATETNAFPLTRN